MADHSVSPAPATWRGAEVDLYRDGPRSVPVADPYRWLEDGSSPEVVDWVTAHNLRTREALVARPTHGRWHERLVALTALPTTLALAVAGERLFLLERAAGADQHSLVVRSALDAEAPGRTLLDPAALAVDGAVAIDWFHPSTDGSLVAFGLSEGGTENSTLHVMRVETGELLPDRIPNTRAASVAWRPDNTGFWYSVYPPADEYHRHIRFHELGLDPAADPVVFDRLPTAESWPDVSTDNIGRFVLVHVMVKWTQVDVHILDTVTGEWAVVVERLDAHTNMRVVGDSLEGVTTLGAPNGRVARIGIADVFAGASPQQWHTVVSERPDVVLGAHTHCGEELFVVASRVGVDSVERWPGGDVVPLGIASVVALDADEGRAFIARGSFGAPVDVYRCSVAHGLERWSAAPDPSLLPELSVRQVHYPSADGTLVPMFVAHRVDVSPSPDTPLILTGYGGFAIAESPVWMPMLAAWCAAGGVYCVAGLRGGFEYGESWHHAGRRHLKQNVFDDFHAAADWLVDEGFTSRSRLAIHGGSNGGLLMGAAITQRPDLAPVVWCAVPLLDMIRFPQFLIARLWTDEYGDPDHADEFGWIYAYLPYHRVEHGTPYPAVLFTTAEGDTRVDPCHARKMTAALTWASGSQHERPILLTQAGRAGHGVGKPAAMRVSEGADVLAFFCWQLAHEDLV